MLATALYNPSPWLLCVDLQLEHVTPGRPLFAPDAQAAVNGCARALKHARRSGWTVIHAHRRRRSGLFSAAGEMAGAVEGLWPMAAERVFRREGVSAFSCKPLADLAERAPPPEIYMIGLSLHQSCLATAMHATDLGLNIVVVSDATVAAPMGGRETEDVTAFTRALLEPHVAFTTSNSLPLAATPGLHARGA